jgi:hypothetical protein
MSWAFVHDGGGLICRVKRPLLRSTGNDASIDGRTEGSALSLGLTSMFARTLCLPHLGRN